MTARHLIEVKDLTFGYRGRPPLFDGAALAIHEDDQIGLWADNGTGKTTLLRILTGLVRPQSMTLTLDGRVISDEEGFRAVRRHFGFVLQNPDDQLFFPEVLDDVMFGPLNLGLSYEEARERSEAALGELGIAELAHAESFRLSGGQKRLVSLACVLSMAPDGLLLDEPTAGLDRGARERLIRSSGAKRKSSALYKFFLAARRIILFLWANRESEKQLLWKDLHRRLQKELFRPGF